MFALGEGFAATKGRNSRTSLWATAPRLLRVGLLRPREANPLLARRLLRVGLRPSVPQPLLRSTPDLWLLPQLHWLGHDSLRMA